MKLQTSVQFYHVHRQIARELNHFFVRYVRKSRITGGKTMNRQTGVPEPYPNRLFVLCI